MKENQTKLRLYGPTSTRQRGLLGGDVAACLSAVDIDDVIGLITAAPAAAFHRLQHSHQYDSTLQQLKRRFCRPRQLTVIHIRYHLVLALIDRAFDKNDTALNLIIYDSARSHPVERDIRK
ncbi:MAG: hypothetical protein FJ267_19915, partial [Planctomycetes bacterium]|nr:hypothetical protein [Planctomycetota bacterium]